MIYLLTAIALLSFSAIPGALARSGSIFWERCSLFFVLSGCVLGLFSTAFILFHPEVALFNRPWHLVPGAALSFKLDALSAIFMIPAFLVTAAGALYGSGYWSVKDKPHSGAWLRFFYPLLAGSILLLLCCNNAFLFLMSWETMALSGYFLVITERQSVEAHKAGFVYICATHCGTLALFGAFALLLHLAPGDFFPAAATLDGAGWVASSIFIFALLGFGFKAGFIPLHIWLPAAHANAPSNVSALMSGVMIKMGIYGLVRTTSFFATPPLWWGQTILILGLIAAIFGVVMAIAQHDIKRLLAYHSVENIGIILLGCGIALVGRTYNNESMILLGMAGALLHVINHGLFKALLFLSAGSIIHKTGTRTLMHYGGLLRKMPYTGFFFLGGAIAICGLPPLNGFVSEWLVYMGIFSTVHNNQTLLGLLAAPGLAMTGGLALLCFAKVFGLAFLGTPRTSLPVQGDSPKSMLLPMGLLFGCCLWIGVAPATLTSLLQRGVEDWSGALMKQPLTVLVSVGNISLGATVLILLIIGLTVFLWRKSPPLQAERPPTWGCGYSIPIPRAQYTTSSFAQIINDFFSWALQTHWKTKKPTGIFPGPGSSLKTHTPDVLLDHLLHPLFAKISAIALKTRHFIQHGLLGYYFLYFVFAIGLLLILVHP